MKAPKFKAYYDGKFFRRNCWFGDIYSDEGIIDLPKEEGLIYSQFSGILDKNKTEVYADDILSDGKKTFRVYHIEGGFVIKAYAWADNKKELVQSDELIYEPMANPQTRNYISESCVVVGNIHEHENIQIINTYHENTNPNV
jgi:hypothetical protein